MNLLIINNYALISNLIIKKILDNFLSEFTIKIETLKKIIIRLFLLKISF